MFSMTEHSSGKKPESFYDNFQPKAAFFLGLATGFAVMFTVGFFLMLYVFLNGGDLKLGSTTKKSNSNTNTSAALVADPTTPTAAGDIEVVPVSDSDWVEGGRDAEISVIEYSDLECPFCKRHHPTLQKVVDNYEGKVNWVYRHFPLTSLHSKAVKEGEASECAGELGGNDGFWAFINKLYEITPSNDGLDLAELPKIAEDIGLNRGKFEECLNSGKYKEKVEGQGEDAVAAGGQGTPYNIVISGDEKIPVSGALPYEQFVQIIDSLLQK